MLDEVTEIKRVYVDMVADLFHYGHVNFLRQASSHGEFLLVGIHADETVESYKRRPILSMEERIASVEGCKYVDEVVPNAPLEITREWIEKHNIDLIMHGDDVDPEVRDRWYKVPIEMGIYQSVGYTEGISTTELISRIKSADLG
ncbi:adenylyltransferase/cytidyltransferase family protein [Candidatus Lucifugimonas marina]